MAPFTLSAENSGGSNCLTFCLVHPLSLTCSFRFSSLQIFLQMALSFKHISGVFLAPLPFFIYISWQSSGPTYSKVQQLTKRIFADCRHHTRLVIKEFEDQSCSALTKAITRTSLSLIWSCAVQRSAVWRNASQFESLKSVTSARSLPHCHVKRSPKWINKNLADKCQVFFSTRPVEDQFSQDEDMRRFMSWLTVLSSVWQSISTPYLSKSLTSGASLRYKRDTCNML